MGLDPQLAEWLNLGLRWLHVIAAMAWIGASFFFNWLDSHLEAPERPRGGVEGELWMVHSGGFYMVEKLRLAPQVMPRRLHWFKWEAAFTWISGFLLLALIYYAEAAVFLVDPAVADIAPAAAIALGLAALAVTWAVYDGIWTSRLSRYPGPAAALSFALAALLAFALAQVFGGRAAFLHVGAALGTVMVANVWMRIVPAQRALIAAAGDGGRPDPLLGARAKQRSLHNNYMTLPVVFAMIGVHYPAAFGHPWNWLLLIAVSLLGAGVRHYFNLRNRGRDRPWILAAAALGAVLVAVAAGATRRDFTAPTEAPVAFAEVRAVVAGRCAGCHATRPTEAGFDTPPKGLVLEQPVDIRRAAARIQAQAVLTSAMPPGNLTGMTEDERMLLGRWVAQGAPLQ